MIEVKIWKETELWVQFDYSAEENQLETIEFFAEALESLRQSGDTFTLTATKL